MQCTIHFEKLPKYTYSIAWNKISMYLTCISVFHENVYSKCTTESELCFLSLLPGVLNSCQIEPNAKEPKISRILLNPPVL